MDSKQTKECRLSWGPPPKAKVCLLSAGGATMFGCDEYKIESDIDDHFVGEMREVFPLYRIRPAKIVISTIHVFQILKICAIYFSTT